MKQCPGQDTRYWSFEDIFEIPCTRCEEPIEFFKDDHFRICDACGSKVANPKLDLGCREHCSAAGQCELIRQQVPDSQG